MNFFQLVAPFYDAFMKLVGHSKTLKKAVRETEIKEDDVICDIGAGTGQLLDFLPEDNELILVDASEKMLKKAEKRVRGRKARLVQAQVQKLPLDDDCCDIVFCLDALHHFTRTGAALAEMNRIAKESGQVIILEFYPSNIKTKVMKRLEELAGEPGCFYSPDKLADFFYKYGRNTKIVDLSSWQYLLIASHKE